jgi:hypothetical protein
MSTPGAPGAAAGRAARALLLLLRWKASPEGPALRLLLLLEWAGPSCTWQKHTNPISSPPWHYGGTLLVHRAAW